MSASQLVQDAFDRLALRTSFDDRPDQIQLALLLCDLIQGGATGLFEAPTGLGKSLATLIPAIACAIAEEKVTVIATYTNVLAEQYWEKDLPLALSLFSANVKTGFLVGRQRYLCLENLAAHAPKVMQSIVDFATIGTESEFRRAVAKNPGEAGRLWRKVQVPEVCPARACPRYDKCFYFNSRKRTENAKVIITNHNVVIQDAIMRGGDKEVSGLLPKYDFLILDEAHDFASAAASGLDFELSEARIGSLLGIAHRLDGLCEPLTDSLGTTEEWHARTEALEAKMSAATEHMQLISQRASNGRIIAHDPAEISTSPGVSQALQQDLVPLVADVAENVQSACEKHAQEIASELEHIKEESDSPEVRSTIESARNYLRFIRDFAHGAHELSTPPHASVSSVEVGFAGTKVKREYFDLKHPLTELLWKHKSYACLSATMQLDGEFEFFTKLTGATGEFCEVLGSPFDFGRQMSIYLPEPGLIPDPTLARSNNSEPAYYHALAREISSIIEIMEGKTLVLFHSRKEMQAVRDLISISDEWPILMQESRGVGSLGEQFKKNIFSSLFALRSFWTGFDAPGETCSCVVLVRIPFEVPIEPIQLAKMAYIQMNGEDPFATHSLSNAKMIMRQGAGRLIRSLEDRGVLALLDPRLRTKRYGESIMANFPPETRVFSDFADAAGWVGL